MLLFLGIRFACICQTLSVEAVTDLHKSWLAHCIAVTHLILEYLTGNIYCISKLALQSASAESAAKGSLTQPTV